MTSPWFQNRRSALTHEDFAHWYLRAHRVWRRRSWCCRRLGARRSGNRRGSPPLSLGNLVLFQSRRAARFFSTSASAGGIFISRTCPVAFPCHRFAFPHPNGAASPFGRPHGLVSRRSSFPYFGS